MPHTGEVHPLRKIRLVACIVSGDHSKILAFQSWLQKLSYRVHEMQQINIINVAGKDGFFSVYNWVRTPIHL